MIEAQVTFNGWILGRVTDRRRLRQLGVRGRMKSKMWQGDTCVFEHCITTPEVMKRLIKERRWAYPEAFTAVDVNGTQLPHWMQESWHREWEDVKEDARIERLNHD